MTKKILILPGDGIGQEVTASAVEVLNFIVEKFNLQFSISSMEVGGTAYDKFGSPIPDFVLNAAKEANAHEFILEQSEKYDTNIGDYGGKLSGGQKQRLTIARAMLKSPSILILDEATSSLDSESEKKIQDAIDKLMVDKTSLIIAHKFSTIKKCDKIILIDKGRILAEGTHDELINSNSSYKNMNELQM